MTEFDVRSSFVSFVDHLPSDIIRKLWLIQSLDSAYDVSKEQLDSYLKQLQSPGLTPNQYKSLVSSVMEASTKLRTIRLESLQEAKSISATINLAKLKLENQHQQLERDHLTYQNETEVRDTLSKHSQRNNKRTNSRKPPKVQVGIAIKKPNKVIKRQRGRPQKLHIHFPSNPSSSRATNATPRKKNKSTESVSTTSRTKTKVIDEVPAEEEGEDDEDTKLYCLCKKPSFGDMVACDNPRCRREWFHYGCVGLTRAPRGEWFCPPCRKRNQKKAIQYKS